MSSPDVDMQPWLASAMELIEQQRHAVIDLLFDADGSEEAARKIAARRG